MRRRGGQRSLTGVVLIVAAMVTASGLADAPATMPSTAPASQTAHSAISVETHFSPAEEIAPTIVALIDDAQASIEIAAFSFTHRDIAAAAIRAHRRGVRVRMISDTTQASMPDSLVPNLIKAGIEVRVRRRRGNQHSKYLIIDQKIVVTGSYNFTIRADERNSENLLVIRDAPKVIKDFLEDYQALGADSVVKE